MKFDPLPTFRPVDKLDGEWIVNDMRVKEPWLYVAAVWEAASLPEKRQMFDHLMSRVQLKKGIGGQWHGNMRKAMNCMANWSEFFTRRAYVKYLAGDKSYGYKMPPPDIATSVGTLNQHAPVLEDGAVEKINELTKSIGDELMKWRDGGVKPDWMDIRHRINAVARDLNSIDIIDAVRDEVYDDIFDNVEFGSGR